MGGVEARAIFRCPACGAAFAPADGGPERCPSCGAGLGSGGVLDFVRAEERRDEQAHYDEVYGHEEHHAHASGRAGWDSLYYPMNRVVRARVGDVRGRTLLLLGNGTSTKELEFLDDGPELLVVSDLSPAALRAVRAELESVPPQLVFAAIDALDLPLADESVDLLYGYAFVHHLPDVEAFLAEAVRVLRPGGRCVFLDDAYSPAWQWAKTKALRPLMRYFHRLNPPSPEDLRFTLAGGFREDELARTIRGLGCEPWFERGGFVHYLVVRASERLPPREAWRRAADSDAFLGALIRADDVLARIPALARNQIRLVWGLDKPARA